MNKIIITGATSMIGTALIEVAVREGTEVYALIRQNTKRQDRIIASPLVHIVYGSLENLEKIDGLPNDCDVLYHFAWAGTSKSERDNPDIHEKNIKYTLDAVRLAEKCGCRRFVGAGSQAEYGPVDGIIDNNTRYSPITSYGVAKYAASILSGKFCKEKNIEYVWGRIFSVYGPHDNDDTMLEYAIRCWNNGKIAQFSAGLHSWNYLYESDAGEMFYRLGCDNVLPGSYFVANHKSKLLREYIDILIKAYGDGARAEFSDSPGNALPGLDVDMSETAKMLNFIPIVDFETGIRNMIASMR